MPPHNRGSEYFTQFNIRKDKKAAGKTVAFRLLFERVKIGHT